VRGEEWDGIKLVDRKKLGLASVPLTLLVATKIFVALDGSGLFVLRLGTGESEIRCFVLGVQRSS
jgi:hypothetical protein